MAETSKCVTVSISQPQVTINKVYVTRNGISTTTIYTNESIANYEFVAEITISGGTIPAITFKLYVNNVEVVSGTLSGGFSPGTSTWSWPGSTLSQRYGWTTIGDMLNAVGAGSKTSVDICHKLIW